MIKLSKYKGKYNFNKANVYFFIRNKTDIFGHGFNLKETIELFTTNKKICRRDEIVVVEAIEKYLELVIEKEYNSIEELKLDYIEYLI